MKIRIVNNIFICINPDNIRVLKICVITIKNNTSSNGSSGR